MYLHMSFNIMTLGGMAAAVGLITDDTVVMVEHIIRRLRADPGDHQGRVMRAGREFTRPLAGSSASTIIIFAPLAFLSGVTGAFFKALSLTLGRKPFYLIPGCLACRAPSGGSSAELERCRPKRGRNADESRYIASTRAMMRPLLSAHLAVSSLPSFPCFWPAGSPLSRSVRALCR